MKDITSDSYQLYITFSTLIANVSINFNSYIAIIKLYVSKIRITQIVNLSADVNVDIYVGRSIVMFSGSQRLGINA